VDSLYGLSSWTDNNTDPSYMILPNILAKVFNEDIVYLHFWAVWLDFHCKPYGYQSTRQIVN